MLLMSLKLQWKVECNKMEWEIQVMLCSKTLQALRESTRTKDHNTIQTFKVMKTLLNHWIPKMDNDAIDH